LETNTASFELVLNTLLKVMEVAGKRKIFRIQKQNQKLLYKKQQNYSEDEVVS
jgi:hypothetical protein